jgi:hypothetical protein
MPDLSAIGVTLPSQVPYVWTVTCAQTDEPGIDGDPVLVPIASVGMAATPALGTSASFAQTDQRAVTATP